MRVRDANEITGGLSKPSKMPCSSYCLPASRCITGSKLRTVDGSACSICYALKGRNVFPNVQRAHERRYRSVLRALSNDTARADWIAAMAFLIARRGNVFRWHSSGDVQSTAHCSMICEVARATAGVRHWIPTREFRMWNALPDSVPNNLTVRHSAHMIDGRVTLRDHAASIVTRGPVPRGAFECPATVPGNAPECGTCRACWDPTVHVVAYHAH